MMNAERKAAVNYWTSLLEWITYRAPFSVELEKIVDQIPTDHWCDLDVDYDPEGLLLDALRASGIDCRGCLHSADGIFPRKHRSQFGPGYFRVSEGRGSERRYLVGDEQIEKAAKETFAASARQP